MPWRALTVPILLDVPPSVKHVSICIHRFKPVERYLMKIWSLHVYLDYCDAEMRFIGHTLPIRPGYASVTPPGADLEFLFRRQSEHISVHFMLPEAKGSRARIPVTQDLGARFAQVRDALLEAIRFFPTQPRRTEARVWDILWLLAEAAAVQTGPARGEGGAATAGEGAASSMHPALSRALEIIELRLAEPLRVAELAGRVDVSHNHLTRLFRSGLGETVVGYICRRRIERARHLLVHTTRSIKAIAVDVGIPDPHLFNKTIRRGLGAAPRAIRESAGGGRRAPQEAIVREAPLPPATTRQ